MKKIAAEPHLSIKAQELAQHDGERLTVSGAVHKVRRFGGLYFVVIRDGKALIQCKVEPGNTSISTESYAEGSYITATGICRKEERAPHGAEIELESIKVLSKPAGEMPFSINRKVLEASLDTKFAPSAINLTSSDLQIGNRFIRTLFISTLPRFLGSNWFSQIINLDRILDISIYVHPDDPGRVLKRLRDKLGRLQAQAMDESEQGKVRNPILDTAIGDIEDLRDKIQQGTDKFFQFGLYVTLYATTREELDSITQKIIESNKKL